MDRYLYLLKASQAKEGEADERKDERLVEEGEALGGQKWTSISIPSHQLRIEAGWLAISAIEAFFSWTEHIFIHIAILGGRVTSARDVASLAEKSWPSKFNAALDVNDPETKALLDRLISLRREVRNYVAHGAFGKQGEAFTFHSGAGAVPVLLPHRSGSRHFAFGHGIAFESIAALDLTREFASFIWAGSRAPAGKYIQESGLPIILTMAADGAYRDAMQSLESMDEFIDYMTYQFDQAANMDW